MGEQVAFAIKNNFDKNSIAEIKDGKSAQLMEILRGFITTSTYSHKNNTFDLFNSIDKMNDISLSNYMGTAQNSFNNISFEIRQKNNKNNNYEPTEPSM